MNCTEAQLKAQAIIDNELEEQEIDDVIAHIESCYTCRNEYVNLLKLQRKMGRVSYPEPPEEWFEALSRSRFRNAGSFFGRIVFLGSYMLLFGYFLFQYFSDAKESLFQKITLGGVLTGLLLLFLVTLCDRIHELKNDKYGEVEK
ncbi:MAG: zf-HC2 domain-containing protein [Spirochaetales bacterium]|nr:zf-HC2 domain-containing protein [Spirochaetales bacterium]